LGLITPIPTAAPGANNAAGNAVSGNEDGSVGAFRAVKRFGQWLGFLAGLWHLTSLDAPTVAVVWTLSFAWAAGIRLPVWVPAIVLLGAWAVYVGDRLLDARVERGPLRERHRFHWRYRRVLAPLAAVALCAALILAIRWMPAASLVRTCILGAAAAAYFAAVHLGVRLPRPASKELLVGVIFTLACAGPTLGRMTAGRLSMLPVVACFVLLAWLNCSAIESWEGHRSRRLFWLAMALAKGCLMAAVLMAALGDLRIAGLAGAAAVSAGLLAGLDRYSERLSPLALRVSADWVLLAPVVLLLWR
jgi:hypothetical protein